MQSPRAASNPFALMTHPQAVLAAVEASDRLRSLRSRVCRPLDRVGAPGTAPGEDNTDVGGWAGVPDTSDAETSASPARDD